MESGEWRVEGGGSTACCPLHAASLQLTTDHEGEKAHSAGFACRPNPNVEIRNPKEIRSTNLE